MESKNLAHKISELIFEKKGYDVKILKLKGLSSICDYFVIVSGNVDVHVQAIAESIFDGLNKKGVKPWQKEGTKGGSWILLDYVDVVVHIFKESTREFYALEKLWGDAPVETIK